MVQRFFSTVRVIAFALCGLSLVPANGAETNNDEDSELAEVKVTATRALASTPIPIFLSPRIGPIFLGFSRSQVEELLGIPDNRTFAFNDSPLNQEFSYPGFSIWLRSCVPQAQSTAFPAMSVLELRRPVSWPA
jgi:hypothetical protein